MSVDLIRHIPGVVSPEDWGAPVSPFPFEQDLRLSSPPQEGFPKVLAVSELD